MVEKEKALAIVRHQHKIISDDLVSLVRRTHEHDEASAAAADEGDLWEDISENEFEEQARAELEYDDEDLEVMAINATDDPILQAHTETSEFRHHVYTQPIRSPVQQRYLITKFRQFRSTIIASEYDRISMDVIKSSVRSFDSKVSLRTPKDFISLAAEPTSGAGGEFSSEVDNRVLNVLVFIADEKLARYKEVEELYDEIMKTVRGSHLETDEGKDHNHHHTLSLRRKRRGQMSKQDDKNALSPDTAQSQQRRLATILLSTRTRRQGPHIEADEFIHNRQAAMKKTQSSKYTMRYNFGGYIPTQVEEQHQKPREEFCASDYAEYLREHTSDFLATIIFQNNKDDEQTSDNDEEGSSLSAEERRKALEERKRNRKERLERLFAFKQGVWNAEVLDYMHEIGSNKVDTDEHEFDTSPANAAAEQFDTAQQSAAYGGSNLSSHSTPHAGASSTKASKSKGLDRKTPTPTPSSIPTPTKMQRKRSSAQQQAQDEQPTVNQAMRPANMHEKDHGPTRDPQLELEALWITLKMPLDQKLDMAIKYGSHKFTKMATALKLWKTASEFIVQREALLEQIERFEMTASDPAKGYTGSSAARLKESEQREDLMRRMHTLENKISEVSSHIKYELREVVTYD
eukprot:jgi/Hompol1/2159/HPOL_002068-RA